ncbi:molybdopterin-dependent oxidoreductase [Streptomyces sp. NPDC048172]|uniref:molybdopterin-dependent oxidoreductase n=1 Tax=Streptomyces sp. NPDC048172 TaxID=3365505 RepID=UPI00370FD640
MSDRRDETSGADGSRGLGARWALGALSGLLAGYTALAVAELASVPVRPEAGPVVAVGGAVIDRTPVSVKDWAVRTFGNDDKFVLQLGIVVLLALFAVAVGMLAVRHRRLGAAGVLGFGALGAFAALSRPDAATLDAVPSLAGAVAGALVLHFLVGRMSARNEGREAGEGTDSNADGEGARSGPARRRFVLAAGAVAAGATGAGALGRGLNASSGGEAVASRDAVRLPRPVSPAAPVPRGAELGVKGLSPFRTPNRDFYRVDTLLRVPRLTTGGWSLRIHGEGVRRPLTLEYDELLGRGLIERDITMTCVSNEVGGSYVGNARWLGVPLAPLLSEAGVRPPSRGGRADQLVARSEDGMTLGSPVETVMDGRDAMLAVGMNGEPLPFTHGFPVRMLVPGLYGYVSACKWLRELELTTFDDFDVYWVERDWSRRAPVKTQSRIDTPRPLVGLRRGTVPVAGVAWAQHRGIDRVEVRVGDGPWHRARLADEDSTDTWRQWVWEWDATPGTHRLQVRATDRTGRTQTPDRQGTVPDGATGRHSVVVTVT